MIDVNFIKNRNIAIYKEKEYSAGITEDDGIVLRSYDIEALESGFKEKRFEENVIYIKYVNREDVSQIFDRRTRAIYNGHEFEVVNETEEMVSIVTMKGDYRVWEEMDMQCIDKGIYQKWVNKNEVEIKIEKEQL